MHANGGNAGTAEAGHCSLLGFPNLTPVEPSAYRGAVHCCAHKLDLSDIPDRAVALFEHESVAHTFGRLMWPTTYEVVDRQPPQEGDR